MPSNDLTFTLIQSSIYWEDKPSNLQMFQQKIESISQKTEVVILPEMFSTGFTMNAEPLAETMDGRTVQWMKETSAKYKIILVGSLIIASPPSPLSTCGEGEQNALPQAQGDNENCHGEPDEPRQFYNRLIWMLPNGQYGFYDKRHLFGFAGEDKYYAPGTKRLIASVKGWKINLQICYDLRFPVWARQSPTQPGPTGEESPEYDILVNIANWGAKRSNAWKTFLQARAIENQCYTIGVNRVGVDGNGVEYSGDSMVVGPWGEVLYHKEKEEDIFTITLTKETLNDVRQQFPFLKDGDGFAIF